jgi:hypothetical protein
MAGFFDNYFKMFYTYFPDGSLKIKKGRGLRKNNRLFRLKRATVLAMENKISISLSDLRKEIENFQRSRKISKVIVSAVPYLPRQMQKNDPGVAVFFFEIQRGSERMADKVIELVKFPVSKIMETFFTGSYPASGELERAAHLFNRSLSYIASRIGEELERKGVKGLLKKDREAEQRGILNEVEFFQNEDPAGYFIELGKSSVKFFPPPQCLGGNELSRRIIFIQKKKNKVLANG